MTHTLYYKKYSFFCQKVLRFLKGKGFDIDMRSTADRKYQSELVAGGGKGQVPCLRIEKEDGQIQWMYESNDIIKYFSSN